MAPTPLDTLGRHPSRTIAAIGLLFVLAYGSSLVVLRKPDGRIVVGDATHYFVYLRSLVFDRDLDFRNDYNALRRLHGRNERADWSEALTPTGRVRNLMSIGPAIVWAPGYLAACGVVAVGRLFGSQYPLDGVQRVFQASAGFSGVIAATIGAWFTYLVCTRSFSPGISLGATVTMWLGSSAIYYSVISPTYSHAASMLVVSRFLLYWANTRSDQTAWRYARVGVLGGLCALVRWQDGIFLIVPVVDAAGTALGSPNAARFRHLARNLVACGVGALIAASPQMWAWMVLYGRPLVVPQGTNFMEWTSPDLLDVLFSRMHGLLSWTPVVALGLAGLPLLYRRDQILGVACAAAFLLSWYSNAAVADWWAGEAYGARRLVSCFPIFALGLAACADRISDRPAWLAGIAVAFIGLNFLLLLQYQAFMHGIRASLAYPTGALSAPLDLARWLLSL